MVCTGHAPRRQQFHVAPAMQQPNSDLTTSVDIPNPLFKATIIYLEPHTTRAQPVCSEAVNNSATEKRPVIIIIGSDPQQQTNAVHHRLKDQALRILYSLFMNVVLSVK